MISTAGRDRLRLGRGSPLARLLVTRALTGLGTLFVVSLMIYGAIDLLPGDLAREVLQAQASDEAVAAFNATLGLDRPFHERYLAWLGAALTGDFGKSLVSGVPVSTLIGQRVLNSVLLALYAAVMAVPLAISLGIAAAILRRTLFDRLSGIVTLAFVSLPEYALGYLLVFLLAVRTGVFPSLASVEISAGPAEFLYRAFLPALALTLIVQAHMSRMTRATLISLLRRPYIEMAALKGLSRREVVVHHALPNGLGPIAVVVTLNLAYLLTGIVVIEAVFAFPGLGQLMVDAVSKRDIPLVQASSLIFATFYVFMNTLADVIGILANPRLMHRAR